MHEPFSAATGQVFIIGIVAVAAAFAMLVPLPEHRLPTRQAAEASNDPADDAVVEPGIPQSVTERPSLPA